MDVMFLFRNVTLKKEPKYEDEMIICCWFVVLVDDVREFDGSRGYLTIDELKAQLDGLAEGRQFYHLDNIFRWHA